MKMNPGHGQYEQADGFAELSRRGFLGATGAAGISVAAAGSLGLRDLVALRAEDLQKKGMSVIVLWMQGGPSQFETF
nr:twin-arginine translocation signal domain-containing protein [Planctomycetota bacterium]